MRTAAPVEIEVVRDWDRDSGDDLPENVVVFQIRGGARRYSWGCLACEMSQQCATLESAFDLAWNHATNDLTDCPAYTTLED